MQGFAECKKVMHIVGISHVFFFCWWNTEPRWYLKFISVWNLSIQYLQFCFKLEKISQNARNEIHISATLSTLVEIQIGIGLKRCRVKENICISFSTHFRKSIINLHGYFWYFTQCSKRLRGTWKSRLLLCLTSDLLIRWWKMTQYPSKWWIVGCIYRYGVVINSIQIKQEWFSVEEITFKLYMQH